MRLCIPVCAYTHLYKPADESSLCSAGEVSVAARVRIWFGIFFSFFCICTQNNYCNCTAQYVYSEVKNKVQAVCRLTRSSFSSPSLLLTDLGLSWSSVLIPPNFPFHLLGTYQLFSSPLFLNTPPLFGRFLYCARQCQCFHSLQSFLSVFPSIPFLLYFFPPPFWQHHAANPSSRAALSNHDLRFEMDIQTKHNLSSLHRG